MANYRLTVDCGSVPATIQPPQPCTHCGVVDPKSAKEKLSARDRLLGTVVEAAGRSTVDQLSKMTGGFSAHWPEHPSDMCAISAKFPTAVFTLYVNDSAIKFYAEGKEQAEVRGQFPPFDRAKLLYVEAPEPQKKKPDGIRRCVLGEEGCSYPGGDRHDMCGPHFRGDMRSPTAKNDPAKNRCTCPIRIERMPRQPRDLSCPVHGWR